MECGQALFLNIKEVMMKLAIDILTLVAMLIRGLCAIYFGWKFLGEDKSKMVTMWYGMACLICLVA